MRKSLRGPLALALATVALLCTSAYGADFTVTTTASTGPGSLNQAIADANALPGADRIVFNIPGTGVQKIITYTLVVTVPEGLTPNAVITDNLPTGLAFVQFLTYTASSDLSFSVPVTTLISPVVTPVSGATAGNRARRRRRRWCCSRGRDRGRATADCGRPRAPA